MLESVPYGAARFAADGRQVDDGAETAVTGHSTSVAAATRLVLGVMLARCPRAMRRGR
jgi:hypothetical protein